MSDEHVAVHQLYQAACTECSEWLDDFRSRIDALISLAGGKDMLEPRLERLDQLMLNKQDGEVKLNILQGGYSLDTDNVTYVLFIATSSCLAFS